MIFTVHTPTCSIHFEEVECDEKEWINSYVFAGIALCLLVCSFVMAFAEVRGLVALFGVGSLMFLGVSISCTPKHPKTWTHRVVVDKNHHRSLQQGEREPLIVIKPDELIVRTDWDAMLKTATEEELRGQK